MKKVKIRVVSQKPDTVSDEEWKKVKGLPEMEVNAVTGIENVRNSSGLYEIVPEAETSNAPEMPEFNPDAMSRGQLVAAAMQFGVTLSKKNIQTDDLRRLVTKKYNEFMDAVADPGTE